MARIFISHAVADKRLADAFTKFLKEAIGVPAANIFCSSVDGHGIPTGENFSDYMRDQIEDPDLVIMLITETYMEREFCLMELGATWAKSLNPYPIIVSPVDFTAVTRTLGLIQGQMIDDHVKLNQLRTALKGICDLEPRTDEDWDDKREQWKLQLKRILPKLPKATKVSKDAYDKLQKSVDQLNESLSEAEDTIDEKEKLITALKALKDANEVAQTEADFTDSTLEQEFSSLMQAIKDAKPNGIYDTVFKHLIMDHYGKAKKINWYSGDADEFNEAIARNILDSESNEVNWGATKMKKLKSTLTELDYFMNDPDTKPLKKKFEDDGFSADADDLDFWDENL